MESVKVTATPSKRDTRFVHIRGIQGSLVEIRIGTGDWVSINKEASVVEDISLLLYPGTKFDIKHIGHTYDYVAKETDFSIYLANTREPSPLLGDNN